MTASQTGIEEYRLSTYDATSMQTTETRSCDAAQHTLCITCFISHMLVMIESGLHMSTAAVTCQFRLGSDDHCQLVPGAVPRPNPTCPDHTQLGHDQPQFSPDFWGTATCHAVSKGYVVICRKFNKNLVVHPRLMADEARRNLGALLTQEIHRPRHQPRLGNERKFCAAFIHGYTSTHTQSF